MAPNEPCAVLQSCYDSPLAGFPDYEPGFPEVSISLPCSDYRPGEDDLQAFDFIRRFQLDVLEKQLPGVSKVRGSSSLQVAYRLDSSTDLSMATR